MRALAAAKLLADGEPDAEGPAGDDGGAVLEVDGHEFSWLV